MIEISPITRTITEDDPETGLPVERIVTEPDPAQAAGCREVRWDAERGKYVGVTS